MLKARFWLCIFAAIISVPHSLAANARSEFSMQQVLHYPFATELAAAERGDAIAWVCNLDGVRNIWLALFSFYSSLRSGCVFPASSRCWRNASPR